MKRKMSVATLVALGAFVLAALSGVLFLPSSDSAAFAQSSPSVAVSLSPSGSVEQGTAITATMSFSNLEDDADTSTTDYIFRADVIGAGECEGGGLGKTRYMYKVDEDPETRGATISAGCPAGDYTLRVSISSPDNVELASASAAFSVTEPEVVLEGRVIEFVPEGALASAQQAAQPTEPGVFGSISGGTVSLRWSDPGDGCKSHYQTYSRRYASWSVLGRDLAPETASWTNGFAILVWHPEGRTFGVWCNATAVESGSRPLGRKLGEVAFFGGDHAGNAPVAPGNVSITPRDGELAVSWDAPANPSSSPIKNTIVQYQVQWKSGSEDWDAGSRQAVTELPPALSHTITGLTNATEYTVRVRAVSTVHDGAWSSGAAATPAVSDDATLSSLALTSPATDLDPAFDSATTPYAAEVSTGASSIRVTADTTDDGASYEVKLDGVADDDGTLSLTGAGPFTITVEVTARTGGDYASSERYLIVPDDAPAAQDFGERMVSVVVTDNDLPLITIAASADPVEEGEAASFTLTRTELANEAVSVTVDFTGTGNVLSGAASAVAAFALNARTAAVSVTTVDDDITEADGSLTATLRALTGYRVGAPATVIVEDDDLVIDLALSPVRVSEDGGGATVTVTAMLTSGARTVATVVDLTVSGSGVAGAVDFTPVTPFTLTIPPNATRGQATFRLTPLDDGVDETDETVTVSGAVAALPSLVVNAVALTLTDDDAASETIALSLDRTEVAENAGDTTVTVTATLNASARTAATEVALTVSGSGAADAVDFTPVQSFILTIPPNVTSGQAKFTLTPIGDVVDESNETVTVSGAVAAAPTLAVHAASLTLTDDDEASDAIALSLSPAEVGEGAGAATVTVTARMNAGARTEPTELTVAVTGDTAIAGTDFVGVNSFTLTIPADAVSGQATFMLTPTPDDIAEGGETITVSGEEVVDATQMETALPVSPATLSLTDDDTASTRIDLSVDRLRFTETSPAATVTATAILDGGSRTTETRVSVSVMGGTADAGDFAPVASFTLTIPATQTRGEATFTLEPLADNLLEGDETIVVSGRVTAGGTLPVIPVTITLADEFTASTEVTLRVRPTTVSESVGSRGQLVNVLAEMNAGARTTETVIRVTVSGSGTEEAVDFEPVQDFDLTIPANHTGGAATFTLAAVDDDMDEEDETITFSGAVAALPALTVIAATLTLTDDDDAADAITLSLDRTEIAEGDGATTVKVTATLNGNARTLATAVTVLVGGDAGDTATAGTDFTAVDSFTLTIPANLKTGQETFTLTPLDDREDEEDETIAVRGAVPALPGLTVNAATLTLTDNDTRGMTVSPDTMTILEGASDAYTVALATQPSAEVTVTVTGAAGTDLTVTGPPLTFTRANWSEPQTVTVAAGHDHDALADAVVTLTNTASGGDYGAVSAGVQVTIAEDDSLALALSKTELTVTEGDPSGGAYTVALATLPSANVTVTVTGASGTDLTVTGPPLTFTRANWSQTQTVTVTARHDDDALADAVVTLTNTASGGDYGAVSAGVEVTITEDDSPALVLSTTGFSVTEGGAAGTYTVALATLPSAEVTVTVTGASGTDLTVVGSPLTFTTVDWDQPQTVTVTAALDVNRVADGTVTLTHTASGADYGAVSADITVTITRAISTDATLSALELSGVTFTPTFAPGETTYEANALYSVASTTVTATPNHARATAVIKLDGTEDADRTVDLAVGANVITVEVTAEDGSDKTYTVTVTRAKATVTISPDAAMADEGDALSFTVTRSPSAADALTVKLDVSETGTFVPPGNEGMKTVTIPANMPSAKHTVRIVAGDEVWDAHSTVTVAVVADTDYMLGADVSAQTQVLDDDFPTATAELAVDPNPAAEGGTVTVTVTVTTGSDQEPHEDGGTVTLSTAADTAQTADYGALSATTFTLAQGDFSAVTVGGNSRYRAAYSATVGIVDDTTEEEDETFSVSMARGSDLDDRVTLGTPVSRTVTISANDAPTNNPPVFPSGTITRSVAENTASGQNVGAPVAATDDDDGDTLTYSLEGTDGGSFTIDSTSGQIQTSAALNYEAKSSYSVTVKVNDGTVNVAKAVTISVTDVDEPPGTPDAPTVTAKAGATDSLDVSWTAPANTERPAIDDYNVQYRIGTTGPFTSHSFSGTGRSTTITGLTAGTSYQVQVQAHNDEGDGAWSASGTGSTNAATSTVSTDATLSALSLSGVTFTPAFAPKTTSYRAIVGNSVSATTVTAVTTHDKATRKILIGGVQDLDADVDLAVGDNTITVEVTAEDGVATKTYTVAVTVARAESADGPNIVVAASKRVYDRPGGYRERDLIIALYNLDSDATWSGDNYSGDFSTLDYVHRTDILDAGGSTDMADLERRNECEGPALFERNHIQMSVDREIRKVNENPETRDGGVIDTGDCANDFAVTVTVWSGAAYQSQGRGAAPVAQLTCRFDGSANDDFAELDWEEQGDPGWYYQGYVLCTDANGDLAPDSMPTIPALNWEPPE